MLSCDYVCFGFTVFAFNAIQFLIKFLVNNTYKSVDTNSE